MLFRVFGQSAKTKEDVMAIAYKATELGKIGIEETDGAVTRVFFADKADGKGTAKGKNAVLDEAFRQFDAYLAGKLKAFTLPLAPAGTPFQRRVWQVLETIPYGATWSYKEVATRAGNPLATRAVGMANNRNPIVVIVPCHRVIGADGRLVGYGGGLERKAWLLELEKRCAG
jgi:methylated-DNA-[protein]-cysteine S-methyltransferase